MTSVLRAEFIKLTKRKLYWVMVLVLAAVMAMVAFFLLVFPTIAPEDFAAGFPVIEKPQAYSFGAVQALGQTWFPVVLAAILLGGETSTSIWAGALTMESRRWLHLLVKIGLTTVAAWVAMVAATLGWAVVAALFAAGGGAPSLSEWLGIAWKAGLTELAWVTLGFGATGLLRSVGPSIGLGLGFTFLEGILTLWRPWQDVSLSLASSRLIGEFGDLAGGFGFGGTGQMSFAQAVSVVFGWGVVGGVAAWFGLQVRDP